MANQWCIMVPCLEVKACGRNKYLRGQAVACEFTLKRASKHIKVPKHSD
jgi:hypothetical protein